MGGLGQERKNVMYNYVTEEQVSRYKSLFQSILDRLREKLKREYGTEVRIVLVGSGASNMVTRNGNDGFDLDYNLVLSSIPPEYAGSPQNLKTIVRRELDALVPGEFSYGKDSTSAITCLLHSPDKSKVIFKVDVALILAGKNGYSRLVRDRNTKRYIWNLIRKSGDLKPRLNAIKAAGRLDELADIYRQKKNMYLSRQDNDHPSFVVYIEAINELYQKL